MATAVPTNAPRIGVFISMLGSPMMSRGGGAPVRRDAPNSGA
jgi:hypothetical protein